MNRPSRSIEITLDDAAPKPRHSWGARRLRYLERISEGTPARKPYPDRAASDSGLERLRPHQDSRRYRSDENVERLSPTDRARDTRRSPTSRTVRSSTAALLRQALTGSPKRRRIALGLPRSSTLQNWRTRLRIVRWLAALGYLLREAGAAEQVSEADSPELGAQLRQSSGMNCHKPPRGHHVLPENMRPRRCRSQSRECARRNETFWPTHARLH